MLACWVSGLGEWSCEVGFELSLADSAQLDMWLWSFLPLVRRPRHWHPSPCRSSIACCEWGFVGFRVFGCVQVVLAVVINSFSNNENLRI